jgi:nitrite reductase (NADH) small subunit
MLVEVADLSSLEEGAIRIFRVGDIEIGLAIWRDSVFAIRNICPHMSAPVCEGYLISMSEGSIEQLGSVELDENRPLIVCPWHGWEWQVADGASITGATPRVKTYPTDVVDGKVLVDLPVRGRPNSRVEVDAKPASGDIS